MQNTTQAGDQDQITDPEYTLSDIPFCSHGRTTPLVPSPEPWLWLKPKLMWHFHPFQVFIFLFLFFATEPETDLNRRVHTAETFHK